MIRLLIALYALCLLGYPVWALLSPETYRGELEEFALAAAATAEQLQLAAGLHFMKNAYLAFAFLLLARYVGKPDNPADVRKAGALLLGFPVVAIIYETLAQIALSPDPENLELGIRIRGVLALYGILGLSLIGIARTLTANDTADSSS